jgi:tetratricopeptide (TPR) repeat protein
MYTDTSLWALDSALKYYIKSYYSWHLTSNKAGLSQVLPNIGNVYSLQNNRDKAIDAYNAALSTQKQIFDSTGMSLTLFNLGMEYYNLGNYKMAQDYFMKSYDIANTFNIADVLKDDMKMMAYILSKDKSDYKKAFDYSMRYIQINDSLNHLTRLQLLDDYSGKFDYQSYENGQLSNSLSKTKLWIIIFAGLTFILLSALVYLLIKRKKN